MYTDQFLNNLIICPKIITEGPKSAGVSRGSNKTVFTMLSADNQYRFSGFITRNVTFHENFSIGLVFIPIEEKGKICLLRCNGPHGEVRGMQHHSRFHIHKVTADDLNEGIKVERQVQETDEYSTFDDAIQFYVKYINLAAADREKYFPPPLGQIDQNFTC